MAMTKCKECKQEVSTTAKKCPHCGVSNPGVTAKEMAIGTAVVVVVLFGFGAWLVSDDESEAAVSEADAVKAEAQMDAEACRQDLQCWGKENWAAATNRCQKQIERQAQYEVKWTDSYPDTKLTRRAWLDQEEGTLTYYGDRVQFSNAYGAFQNYIYRCDYDPFTKTVINLEMEPGRI
ncbi:hypothetical protein [Marinobacter oulmenensis]|uniref:Zinc ribbon domain-containing protein n=1 Tax=Marinobacter oulmenensis TaxID=643747 RepID=A0A840UH24_9GAMM|nr:hypothetical protein [Marinobacter oulmenensis]MBB5320456.1 hypothetical protein [Marinobacter oulmenensis]